MVAFVFAEHLVKTDPAAESRASLQLMDTWRDIDPPSGVDSYSYFAGLGLRRENFKAYSFFYQIRNLLLALISARIPPT
jgi:hypothetical protein